MEQLKKRDVCVSELVALFSKLEEGRYVLEDVQEQKKIDLNNVGDHITMEVGGLWATFNKVEPFLDAVAFYDVQLPGRWCIAMLEHPETWRLHDVYNRKIIWSGYPSEVEE